MKKSVAIIGASASGLRVAKELIQTNQFEVTIFEKNLRVGGLWAVDKDTRDALIDPFMPTNIGRYTQNFSDLAWESVNYQDDREQPTPMFPRAWQVGQYLETYKDKYIPRDALRYGCEITEASLKEGRTGKQWHLTWTNGTNAKKIEEAVYDYIVMASGFFSAPRSLPGSIMQDLRNEQNLPKIIHSTHLRTLQDILPDRKLSSGGKILIVGGGISGADAAASLALMLSSAKHSPGDKKQRKTLENLEIVHVFARHFYALPSFVPDITTELPLNTFVPWDLFSYELSRRKQYPIKAVTGKVESERARITHESIRNMIGSDQRELSPELVSSSLDRPPYVAINNLYAQFVRNGDIKPLHGRLQKLYLTSSVGNGSVPHDDGHSVRPLSAEVIKQDILTEIDDVIGVVYATGYTPHAALGFLSDDVKRMLEYDENSFRLPVLLQAFQTLNPAIPSLAFVGFYEGPYWGIIEMQARLITNRWVASGDLTSPSSEPLEENTAELDKIRDLRLAMKQRDPSTPQFWMADYLGLMENMAAALGIKREDSGFGTQRGPAVPALYVLPKQDLEQPQTTVTALMQELVAARERGRFVAGAAFRALQGAWTLHRKLESALSTFPSGVLTGNAWFHPRYPTDPSFDGEYLYTEEGLFKTRQGFEMSATRSYVYRYSEATDTISVWFVKMDGETVDYLFHNITFADSRGQEAQCWQGDADHLCVKDMYRTSYSFRFAGVALTTFDLQHNVNGPKKDYISDSHFSR